MNPGKIIKNVMPGYFLFLVAHITFSATQPVYLHFHDSITVNKADITLGDIAVIDCPTDKALSIKLAEKKVGTAAPAGFSRYLSVYELIQYLVTPYLSELNVKTNGIKRVKIRTAATVRTVIDYKDQINKYIADNVKWDREDYSVSIKNGDRQWRCYKKPFSVTVDGLETPYPKGNVRLKLRIAQDSTELVVSIICRIKVQTTVVCVSETINRNQVISSDMIELKKMDITAYRYTPVTEISSVLNKIAVKTLSPGTIVHELCLKSLPEVSKGDIVYITLEKGNVRISVSARAREDGSIGDKIWVENTKSHKLIQVKVAGKGVVFFNKGEAI